MHWNNFFSSLLNCSNRISKENILFRLFAVWQRGASWRCVLQQDRIHINIDYFFVNEIKACGPGKVKFISISTHTKQQQPKRKKERQKKNTAARLAPAGLVFIALLYKFGRLMPSHISRLLVFN